MSNATGTSLRYVLFILLVCVACATTIYTLHLTRDARHAKNGTALFAEMWQKSHFTVYNRHPELFDSIKQFYMHEHNSEPQRILSFGCSNGSEALTMLQEYFPRATVVGVDIDDEILEHARNATQKYANQTIFLNANTSNKTAADYGPYDVVLANNVLCRFPSETPTRDFTFEAFEAALRELDHLVKVDGVLMIYNNQYRVEDMNYEFVQRYVVMQTPHLLQCRPQVPQFRPNNDMPLPTGMQSVMCLLVKRCC
jgi:chemotaxis methyl-accepting protein methylase